jgi:hypothetical protein
MRFAAIHEIGISETLRLGASDGSPVACLRADRPRAAMWPYLDRFCKIDPTYQERRCRVVP